MPLSITPLDPWIASLLGRRDEAVTRAAIESYQLQKVRQTLSLARAKSRFYARHLAGAPRNITCLADLARFPFTTAQDIRDQALQFLCVSQGDIQRVVTLDSSGTTGEAKRLYFTRHDQELTIDFFRVGMSTFTGAGDRVLILLPGERPGSVGDLLAEALRRLGAHPVKHGPVQDIFTTLEVLRKEKVDSLVGIPTQVLALARCGDGLKLKSALLTTDHVPDVIARAVEHAWGCLVYNHYGMTEMGLGGGVECQARRGYHLREADLYFEIINPASGEVVADGESGEVVFTTLTRRGMPLIRYRTGDLSRFVPGACPCGTALKTLERVRQRAGSAIAVGDEQSLALADLDEALFSIEGLLDFSVIMTLGNVVTLGDCLELKASVIEGARDDVASAIELALESIPAIRCAQAAGQLDVAITVRKGPAVARPVKRVMTDQRSKLSRG
jgi:phenylacetate-CoA ligase